MSRKGANVRKYLTNDTVEFVGQDGIAANSPIDHIISSDNDWLNINKNK